MVVLGQGLQECLHFEAVLNSVFECASDERKGKIHINLMENA